MNKFRVSASYFADKIAFLNWRDALIFEKGCPRNPRDFTRIRHEKIP